MDTAMDRDSIFKFYSEPLSFLHKSFDDYFYMLDFKTGKIKFFGEIASRYDINLDENNFCTFDDWNKIVYPRDFPRFQEDLDKIL